MPETNYQLITDTAALNAAIEDLSKHQVVGLDIETTWLDPYGGRMRLVQIAAPDGVRIIARCDTPRPQICHHLLL